MAMDERKFVDADGIDTCYYEKGAGQVMVLFHGGNFGSPDAADCALDSATKFDGHPNATHAYAWSSPIVGSTKHRFFAVLHLGGIRSPQDAVRAAIVAEHRGSADG